MPSWALKSNLAALNTARYLIPYGRSVAIAKGIEMIVRSGFKIDGVIVIDGGLTIKDK